MLIKDIVGLYLEEEKKRDFISNLDAVGVAGDSVLDILFVVIAT